MIWGIGHDIVENSRIAEMLDKFGSKGIQRILTESELMLCLSRQDRVKFVAKRFAAKEAFAKACGTGLRAPILLSNISVENDDLGKPYFVFAPPLQNWLDAKGIVKYHLSLSDERSLSSAFVILESE
jgi:holo-[acyl-carrier protein] synthase